MALAPGAKLGRYEIISQLGVGGMGEVYLATDTKLDRRVALKILPVELALSRERMLRFVQEAKAAAALNHPNVAHVYEIGEHDGLNFIAMEFVEGKTLREKIHYEKTELRKLIRYLQQVAGGLAKAHSAGIVHRDLKPDNIMITRDGYAKILDFGLAKLVEIPTPGPDGGTISDAATVALEPHSIPGRLMGTVGYMSPEQAQGKTGQIDHRSDIFSFGCMLFEAVTGVRPFQGESNVQSLYRIVYEQAPLIKDLNPSAPADLQRIIRRCLAKDPDERYQSIQDVALELKELRREMEGDTQLDFSVAPSAMRSEMGGSQTIGPSNYAASAPRTLAGQTITDNAAAVRTTSSAGIIIGEIRKHKRAFTLALVGLLLLVVGIVYLWIRFGRSVTAEPFRAMRITRLTTGGRIANAQIKGYATISPDGKYVVFKTTESGKDSLWVRQVSTGSLVKIVPDVDGKIGGTTFTRDGEFIYYSMFYKDDSLGTLYQVPVLGGPPRRIMGGVTSPVTFSPDGRQLAFVRPSTAQSDLITANSDGTAERNIATRRLPEYFSFVGGPAWSPDGKTIAVGAGSFSGTLSATIVTVPVAGGAEAKFTSQNWASVSRLLWLDDGGGLIVAAVPELVSAGTQLWYVSYPKGQVRRITNDLNAYGTSSLGLTADSKTLVTVQAEKSAQIWASAAELGPAQAQQITNGKYDGDSLAWTADGRILYTAPSGEQSDVWIINVDGTANRQLTSDAYTEGLGCVSPDGRFVVFSSNRSGDFNLWKMEIGSGEQTQLTHGTESDSQPVCTADGQSVLFRSLRQGKSTYWKVPLAGGTPEQLSDKSSTWAAVSPDGKLLALRYVDEQSKANKIAVIPIAGGAPVKTLEVSVSFRDVGLGWTADSKSIVYAEARGNSDSSADNIWSIPIDGGAPKQLTNFTSGLIFAFQMSRDNKQIALSRGSQTDDVILLRDAQ
ncbi:MAG TPA: protein kinase [Pyrinomonadaceae bacterium]|jgi:serine/threonine protein kinase/Tol biopolymer transport system component|nr:protein kinase [Pyrinomonadaceae bacterium]